MAKTWRWIICPVAVAMARAVEVWKWVLTLLDVQGGGGGGREKLAVGHSGVEKMVVSICYQDR